MIKEARFWKVLPNGKVECNACARRCKIPSGASGFCAVRKNIGGKLYAANYGVLTSMQVDPIEKKPFNHFMPGSYVFGIGTTSCNLGCLFCQNSTISKDRKVSGREMAPEDIIEVAQKYDVQAIAYTYNEPTVFIEYALDVAKLAHKNGLKNLFVTNGYMTADVVKAMAGLIDAAVVDFKGNGDEKFANKYELMASANPIKETLLEMKSEGIHIEITDLIIPEIGDSLEACDSLTKWIKENLGKSTPIQFTRFYPSYKMLDSPITPTNTLEEHYQIAKENGLEYVYIGNIPGNKYENTYCPECGKTIIKRQGFYVTEWHLDDKMRCKNCGNKIPIVGPVPKEFVHHDIRSLY